MLSRLYRWTLEKARHRHAERWLGLVSFLESSIFPIPPDVMLLPMTLADRQKAFRFALICTLSSVLGGLAGYGIGYYLWDLVGAPLIAFYGYEAQFQIFQERFKDHGFWLVFLFGLSFFPFKVITLASGVVAMNPVAFLLAALLSRAPRFYIEAALLWKYGAPIEAFIEKRLSLLASLFALLLAGGFIAIRYL
ncbi:MULTISPECIES: YqaA family protein [unclassified Iodidimonas]|jgi:membrane protein YqaA with SNARE-associated domain|uniref:YqaA family protein n=1 Tax=unclassified Iodidimonas TaxID=2626145 RepID=UPI002482FEC7|nr:MULTISPECIES: YqaA family protein [unclassified Iodidimonas]